MTKYFDLQLIEHSCEGMKWGIWTNDDGTEITVVFNSDGEFVGFEDENIADNYDSNWQVGSWSDYDINGEY